MKYILIDFKSKKPIEKDWNTDESKRYDWDDKKLQNHIRRNKNYGVLTGIDNLVVIDCDTPEFDEFCSKNLPKTYTVQSGSGKGKHYYYHVKGMNKIILKNNKGEHVGEIQSTGQQVVGAGSIHPNGKPYKVVNDLPISDLDKEALLWSLRDYIDINKRSDKKEEGEYDLTISQVTGLSAGYQGEHPYHGSTGGLNFKVYSEDFWYCFRCQAGGNAWHLLAQELNIAECGDSLQGKKNIWKKLYDESIKKGFISEKQKVNSVNSVNSVNTSEHLGYTDKLIAQLSSKTDLEAEKIIVTNKEYNNIKKIHVFHKGSQVFTSVHCYSLINSYMDISQIDAKMISMWVLGTYLYPIFNKYPYLFINAPKGSGKSKLVKIITWSSYKGQRTGNTSVAGIYFHIDMKKGALGFDEQEILNDKEKSIEISNILLNGFEKGTPVLRVPKGITGANELKEYDVYCPKVIANIDGLFNSALESRVIPIKLIRTLNMDKANKYPERVDNEFVFAQMQGLIFAKEHYLNVLEEFNILKQNKEHGLVGRNFDLFAPLLAISKVIKPEWYDELLSYAQELTNIIESNSNVDTTESKIIETINFCFSDEFTNTKPHEEGKWILAKDIREKYAFFHHDQEIPKWLTYNKLNSWLNGLGFNLKKKHNDGIRYLVKEDRLNKLSNAYTPKEEDESPDFEKLEVGND